MNRSRHRSCAGSPARTLLVLLALLTALATTGNAQTYIQTNLVSDIPGLAAFTDPNLINPWGIALAPTSPFWISDNGTGLLTLYNGAGKPQSLVVQVPPPAGSTATATPTGQVF